MSGTPAVRMAAAVAFLACTLAACRPSGFESSELPACKVDADCADSSACNGEERCTAGRCESSESIVCPSEMECADRAAVASCEYSTQSPWLVFVNDVKPGFFGLFGIPTALVGKTEPFDLSANVSPEEYLGVDSNEWSPNGRYMLFDPIRHDWATTRLYWMEFGRGLPSEGQPVPNLPNVGAWSVVRWSADSMRVLLEEYESDEFYALDFSRGEPRASRFEGASWVDLCGPGMVYQRGSTEIYWTSNFQDFDLDPLGAGEARVLAGAQHVVITNEEGETSLFPCGPSASRHDLGDATFLEASPDSKFVSFQTTSGFAVLSLPDFSEVLFLENVSAVGPGVWSEDGNRLLVGHVLEAGGTAWQVIDVAAGALETELSIGEGYSARWLGPDLVAVESTTEAADASAWHLSGALIPLPGCSRESIASKDGSTVFCYQESENGDWRLLAMDVAQGGSVRELWRNTQLNWWIEDLSPDDENVLVRNMGTAEARFSQLWWVPVRPEDGAPILVSPGGWAETWDPWQPWEPTP
jgi:hypothetical protein